MVVRLALLCHAPTLATRTASFPADDPLDGPGLERARASAFRVGSSAVTLRSPALAARQTADAMVLPARVEPALRECDYGSWAGRSFEDVQTADPEGIAVWLTDPSSRPHGGESLLTLLDRVSAWLATQDEAGKVVAITHASIVRAAIVAALQAPPRAFWRIDVLPLSATRLRRSATGWSLVSVNQRSRPVRGRRDSPATA